MWLSSCYTHTGLSLGGQPQHHYQNKCDLGQPITESNVKLMEHLFGPDISTIKGYSTRQYPHQLVSDVVSNPHELHDAQCDVCLYIDIMYINGMPFLATISKNIRCHITMWIADHTAPTITSTTSSG